MTNQKIRLWLDDLKASELLTTFDSLAEDGILIANDPKLEFYCEGVEVEAELDEIAWGEEPVKVEDLKNVLESYHGVSVILQKWDEPTGHVLRCIP